MNKDCLAPDSASERGVRRLIFPACTDVRRRQRAAAGHTLHTIEDGALPNPECAVHTPPYTASDMQSDPRHEPRSVSPILPAFASSCRGGMCSGTSGVYSSQTALAGPTAGKTADCVRGLQFRPTLRAGRSSLCPCCLDSSFTSRRTETARAAPGRAARRPIRRSCSRVRLCRHGRRTARLRRKRVRPGDAFSLGRP